MGAKADVVVFDASAPWVVSGETLISGGKNTPFAGYELVGRARYTLVGGEVRHASNR
jgi:dihydroorotase